MDFALVILRLRHQFFFYFIHSLSPSQGHCSTIVALLSYIVIFPLTHLITITIKIQYNSPLLKQNSLDPTSPTLLKSIVYSYCSQMFFILSWTRSNHSFVSIYRKIIQNLNLQFTPTPWMSYWISIWLTGKQLNFDISMPPALPSLRVCSILFFHLPKSFLSFQLFRKHFFFLSQNFIQFHWLYLQIMNVAHHPHFYHLDLDYHWLWIFAVVFQVPFWLSLWPYYCHSHLNL